MGQSRKINRKSPRHNKRTTKRQHGGSDSAWSYVLNQVGPLSEQLSRTFSTTGDNLAMSQSNVLSPKTNINAPDPSSRQIGASMTGDIPKQSGGKRRHNKSKKSKKSKKHTKRGGSLMTAISQAIVPFSILGAQQTFGKKHRKR